MRHRKPLLVGIVGGSGAGKTWLAERLAARLGPNASRLSLDDFYRDRSHLSPARRSKLNFDHPRAIDWAALEKALRQLSKRKAVCIPRYDFETHSRRPERSTIKPNPIILVDGLWLFRRPSLRRLFALRLFIECSFGIRLRRRLSRDALTRGRTRTSIREQFRTTVEPMHSRYVAPQSRWADVVLTANTNPRHINQIEAFLRLVADCPN